MTGWELFDDAAKPDLQPIRAVIGEPRGFLAPIAAAVTAALEGIDTRPQTIVAADRAQQHLIDVLVAHRHQAAAFLDVYHGITVAVIEAIEGGALGPRAFFERLAGRFAERHFDGVKVELGVDTTSDAAVFGLWRPSFALDNLEPGDAMPPMAHFIVGMCCHINFDLACALDETIRELGMDDAGALAQIERGHDFVDTILAEHVERSTERLAERMDCSMSKKILEAGNVKAVGEISMTTIRRWRAKTFVHALELGRAAGDAERAVVRAEIYRGGARKTVRLFNTLPSLIEGTLRGTWTGPPPRA